MKKIFVSWDKNSKFLGIIFTVSCGFEHTTNHKSKMGQPGVAKADIAALGLDQISQRVSVGSSITGPIATGAPLNTNASSMATTIHSSVANSSKSPRRGEIPQQSSHPCLQTALPTAVNIAVLSRVLLGYNSRITYRLTKGFSEGF